MAMPNEFIGAQQKWVPSGYCALLACDIASFGDPARTDDIQHHVRSALYDLLRQGFAGADLRLADWYSEDRGDGVIVVAPAGHSAMLISRLPGRLETGLRRHNTMSSRAAQILLRVALHVGPVYKDDHGIVGHAVNHVFRLLDAPTFKEALQASQAPLAVIVSEHLYQDLIGHTPDAAAYQKVDIHLKETSTRAWMKVD